MTAFTRILKYITQLVPFTMSVQHPSVRVYPNKDALGKIAVTQIISQINEFVERNTDHSVHIATSGGSLPSILSSHLPSVAKSQHSDQIHIWYADERCVPLNDKESNYYVNKDFVAALSVPSNNIHTIDESLIHDPAAAARDYNQRINDAVSNRDGALDILLLGMGPDGHCCSLFPNHSINDVNNVNVTHITDVCITPMIYMLCTLLYDTVNIRVLTLFAVFSMTSRTLSDLSAPVIINIILCDCEISLWVNVIRLGGGLGDCMYQYTQTMLVL